MTPLSKLASTVISADGSRALLLTQLQFVRSLSDGSGLGAFFQLKLTPRSAESRAVVVFDEPLMKSEIEAFGLPTMEDWNLTLLDLATAAIGEHLGKHGLPRDTPSGNVPYRIRCGDVQFGQWKERQPTGEDDVTSYVLAKALAAWNFEEDHVFIGSPDLIRLRISLARLSQIVTLGEGELWDVTTRNPYGIAVKLRPETLRRLREMNTHSMTQLHGFNLVPIISADGRVSILLTGFGEIEGDPRKSAIVANFSFKSDLHARESQLRVAFADTVSNAQGTAFGIANLSGQQYVLVLAQVAIGEYLTDHGLPQTGAGEAPLTIECSSEQLLAWRARDPANDMAIGLYIEDRLFAGWRANMERVEFGPPDLVRLRIPFESLVRISDMGEGVLWKTVAKVPPPVRLILSPLPELGRRRSDPLRPNAERLGAALMNELQAPRYAGAREHWEKALEFWQGQHRDLPNAAKEAICTVEGIAKVLTGRHGDTLGRLLPELKNKYQIDPAIIKSLEGIWGFASNSPGVRHGGATQATIDTAQVRWVIENCDSAARYLLQLDK